MVQLLNEHLIIHIWNHTFAQKTKGSYVKIAIYPDIKTKN